MKLIVHSTGEETWFLNNYRIYRILGYKTNPRNVCACCGKILICDEGFKDVTMEHMVPAWKVGRDPLDIDNMCLLCKECNLDKLSSYGPDIVAYYYPYLTWQAWESFKRFAQPYSNFDLNKIVRRKV